MKVEVALFATLKKYLSEKGAGKPCFIEIDNGTSVGKVLDKLNIPSEIPKIIFVNGLISKEGTILKDGDRMGIFPQVAGG